MRRFDGRLACATNKDLRKLVAEGLFREDLWFRINVVTCTLPPLRERPDDIEPLLRGFVQSASRKTGRRPPEIDRSAVGAALDHGWPGNIREMINRVDRAVALGDGSALTDRDLFPDATDNRTAPSDAAGETLVAAREAAERKHILAALAQTGNSQKDAAELLGISRTTMWEKMRRYGIDGGG